MKAKKKILIVDDETELANFVKMRLEASNFEVTVASDGEECLYKIEENIPDLILLDIFMPNREGFETLRMLKEKYWTKSVPVIMLTAKDSPDSVARALKMGASDYIVKPFESRVLLEKIRKLLG